MTKNTKKYLLYGCAIIVFSFFLIFKILKYNLFYYSFDLFSNLQLTRSWFYGNWPLWENRYGFTAALHNYYTIMLFAPFSIWLGAKGIFAAHAVILFFAVALCIGTTKPSDQHKSSLTFAILFLILAGPVSFWLFDDDGYGWHVELLFLPFSVFFALALRAEHKYFILLTALLLIFTKEDGPVVACAIHLLFVIIKNKRIEVEENLLFKKIAKTIIFWVMVFFLSNLLLAALNHFTFIRPFTALTNFLNADSISRYAYITEVFTSYFILLLPFVLLFLTVYKTRFTFLILAALVPLTVVGLISGFIYFPITWFSLCWGSRFAETIGLFAASGIFLNHSQNIRKWIINSYLKQKTAFLLIPLFGILQFGALLLAREYNAVTEITKTFSGQLQQGVTEQKADFMKCVAENTADSMYVAVPPYYFNLFEWHNYVWQDHLEVAPKKVDLIITEDSLTKENFIKKFPDYLLTEKKGFFILTKSNAPACE